MLEGRRCWCVVEDSKFSVYSDRAEGKENLVMELRVDTASCDMHIVSALRQRTAAIAQQQPLGVLAPQPNRSLRSENSRGSHVTTMSSPEQPSITLKNPLEVKIAEPTSQPVVHSLANTFAGYRELQTAPKSLQRTSNRFAFRQNSENLSVDDMELAQYSEEEGGRQFPSFTMRTKAVGCTNDCVEHTFRCTSARNVEAAEWVDAVVRARGEAIRSKQKAHVKVQQEQVPVQQVQVHQNQNKNQSSRKVLELTAAPAKGFSPLAAIDMNANRSISSPRTPRSSRMNNPRQLKLLKRFGGSIDALTIPLDVSKSDGTRRALQIDRHSEDYKDI